MNNEIKFGGPQVREQMLADAARMIMVLDSDGENRAVRWFLAYYGGGGNKTIGAMKKHLEMSGFDGCWPEWCNTEPPSHHLTKGGAQLWLRYLFDLEKSAPLRMKDGAL